MAFLPSLSSYHQFFFQNHHHHYHHQADHSSDPTSLTFLSSCPAQDFHGHPNLPSLSMKNHHQLSPAASSAGYNNIINEQATNHSSSNTNNIHGDDELSEDEGSHLMVLGEKKKRLNLEQVKILEKNFELGNKLEPERKMQLARALGLQPRQVAIWFQNRRARWKTKQIEKDYNLLKRQFESLKADNDSLHTQNKKLHAELFALKSGKETSEFGVINLNAETKSYCWSNNGSEISSDINLGISAATPTPTPPQDHDHSLPRSNKNKLQFPSSLLPPSLTDLLAKPLSHHHHGQAIQDGFRSLFGSGGSTGSAGPAGVAGLTEQPPPFWAWAPDQHHLH